MASGAMPLISRLKRWLNWRMNAVTSAGTSGFRSRSAGTRIRTTFSR